MREEEAAWVNWDVPEGATCGQQEVDRERLERAVDGGEGRGGELNRWATLMSDLQLSTPMVLVSPEICAPVKRSTAVGLHTCLIASSSASRAQLWVRAAHEEDWATIVCTTADDANRQSVRHRIQLALIDLQSASTELEARFRVLVQQLAARGGPLLAVCGKPEDMLGEVWSRQLGVWMYLPGIDSHSDIALLCSEARSIVKKLGGQILCSRGE